MKRRASRPAPYEVPTKLTKQSTSTTVSRKLSHTLKRASTTTTTTTSRVSLLPPPRWPSGLKTKTPSVPPRSSSSSLSKPDWPALLPPSKRGRESLSNSMTEISEEPTTVVPGLRRLSTLPLEEEKALSRQGSLKMASKTGDSRTSMSSRTSLGTTPMSSMSRKSSSVTAMALATLEKKESVVALDPGGTVTTLTRLASGSSTGETTSAALAPPDVREKLLKASSNKTSLLASRKESSIRVVGTEEDVPAAEVPSLSKSRSGSKGSRAGSVRGKEDSLVPSTSSTSNPVPLPPGGLIEIVFSFDTTGSMSSCIDEVRGRVGDMIQRLQADIPGIRIAVFAHGDYCDAEHFYVIKWIDFGASVPELCDFVQNISGTGGGDFDECYELVLARARTELSWTPGSQRSLVMIGDATPHPLSFYINREEQLSWREETDKLAMIGVKIYAVQAMNNAQSTSFYGDLATLTGGHHLRLNQFNNIFDMLMVLCYNETGSVLLQAYEDEVRTREGPAGLNKDLEGLFSAIRAPGDKPSASAAKVLSKGAAKAKGKPTTSTKKAAAAKGRAKPAATTTTATSKAGKASAKAGAKTAAKTGAKAAAKAGAKTAAKTGAKAAAKTAGAKAAAKTGAKAAAKAGAKTAAKTGAKAAAKTGAKTAGAKAATKTVAKAAAKTGAKTAGAKSATKTAAKAGAKTAGAQKAGAKTAAKKAAKAAAKMAKGKGAKTVKGRKPVKAAGKKKTKATTTRPKKPVPGVRRKVREAVKDEELSQGSCVKSVQWSPWWKAIVPTKPKGKHSPRFGPRRPPTTKAGFRNVSLLKNEQPLNAPAMYEVAVQLKGGRKRYVVFFKAFSSWRGRGVWDTALLNADYLHHEVNAVLRSGGQIWLRRGSLKTAEQLEEVKRHVAKMYDYAWVRRQAAARGKKGGGGGGGVAGRGLWRVRRVKKCRTLISGNSDSS